MATSLMLVSRAFGDIKLKKVGVISQPGNHLILQSSYHTNGIPTLVNVVDISKFTLSDDDQFMVLACDGLFTVMSQENVTAFVASSIKSQLQHIRDHPIPQVSSAISIVLRMHMIIGWYDEWMLPWK
jgi:serine/threonine protein phosphatase PrpC